MAPTITSANQPINVKILLIGNSSVGKSSLLLRFSDEQWLPEDESSATIGVDFRVSCSVLQFFAGCLYGRTDDAPGIIFADAVFQVHKMDIKGKKVKLSIWVCNGDITLLPAATHT
jgi:Ras-related protein Rab-18